MEETSGGATEEGSLQRADNRCREKSNEIIQQY